MSVRHPMLRKLLLWPLLLLTLGGFTGLQAIQTLSLPNELPRATLIRVTGIDIAPNQSATTAHQAMPMGMPGMDMGTAAQDTHHPAPADTHAPLYHRAGMAPPGQAPPSDCPEHSHDNGGCPLCSFLTLTVAIPSFAITLPTLLLGWHRSALPTAHIGHCPAISLGLPPACGPPTFLAQL
ncbi:hypothetical protein [Acetobacter papayae]|uniref:hypothetical protein n=1 Tax=Acetobacter papayae TaxID=1076592 RepID=UPI00046E7256|nr:hypothetical protein [Acetobacter papayae]